MSSYLHGALEPRRPVTLPLPAQLLAGIAAGWAVTVRSQSPPVLPPGARAYSRVLRCDEYDVWVIHWGPDSRIDAHDHARSAGALHVVRGALVEHRRERVHPRLVRSELAPGASCTVPVGRVHAVRNIGDDVATSVHVYSPPLTDMRFYREPPAPAERHLRAVPDDGVEQRDDDWAR